MQHIPSFLLRCLELEVLVSKIGFANPILKIGFILLY